MHVWRISRNRFADSVFTGEGSKLFGGRWNDKGVPMVYTSTSIALAAVETFVNISPMQASDDLIVNEAILPASLHVDFLGKAIQPLTLSATRMLGTEWILANRSAALRVPSFAVEGEWNILLNPAHPDFATIHQLPPKPWHFDPRMFRH